MPVRPRILILNAGVGSAGKTGLGGGVWVCMCEGRRRGRARGSGGRGGGMGKGTSRVAKCVTACCKVPYQSIIALHGSRLARGKLVVLTALTAIVCVQGDPGLQCLVLVRRRHPGLP